MTVKPLEEIKQREKMLRDLLESSVPENNLPVPLPKEEVLKALDQIDSQHIIEQYQKELSEIIEDLHQETEKYESMMFSWCYDGGDIPNNATGVAYETCQVNYDFLFTDRKKGSLEREKPKSEGETFYLGFLSINKVMEVWYADLIKFLNDLDNSFFIVDTRDGESYELIDIYDELFQLKLFSLLAQAYQQIDIEKPIYFFIKKQERWPVLVGDNS